MEEHVILSERLEDLLKAVEWAKAEHKRRVYIIGTYGDDDSVYFETTKRIEFFVSRESHL